MEWAEIDGVVLRYELSGTGRVPLVLIHELGGSLEFWDPVLPAFQQAFRVLRYDLRGCGLSDRDRVDFSFEKFVEDMEVVIDAARIGQFGPRRRAPGHLDVRP